MKDSKEGTEGGDKCRPQDLFFFIFGCFSHGDS